MTASRVERLADRYGDRDRAESVIREIDSRYWALYRTVDVSQSDVQQFVTSSVDTSQATVSRVIRKGDTRALSDPDYVDVGGEHSREGISEQYYPEEWYEAYLDVLARAITDKVALKTLARERHTPEWAARRFPELVGCNHHVAQSSGGELPEFAREDHLTHIDSVNLDRWR